MIFLAFLGMTIGAQADDLVSGFVSPGAAVRPGVWWRWIDGNVSEAGITRDLEQMARKGIRSVDIFDVAGAPSIGPVAMMSPLWRDRFRHALKEAARLGIEVRVVPAAGWGIGGPWIKEADAAKTLRYTETQVDGPAHLSIDLPRAAGAGSYYRDVATVAFRESEGRCLPPREIRASSEVIGYCNERDWPVQDILDGDPQTYWRSAAVPTALAPVWVELRYAHPFSAEAIYLAGTPGAGPGWCRFLAGEGAEAHVLAEFTLEPGETRTVHFPHVVSAAFRLEIRSAHAPDIQLAEMQVLRRGDRPAVRPGIKWWAFKSGQRAFWDTPRQGPAALDEEYPAPDVFDCRHEDVVDLTARLSPAGHLEWEVPAGRWTIARFGVVVLGEPPRAMSRALQGGYEADPYSVTAAQTLFDNTARPLADDAGNLRGTTLTGILVDSYEIGASVEGLQGTWTEGFREIFRRRRGYDLLPYLPAMIRRVVDGRETTDRFLFDYRLTLSELYNDFYARLRDLAHRQGLQLRAENGYGTYPFPHIDGLAAFGRTDVPMGEFWFDNPVMSQFYGFADSVRTAASAAHIYGQREVAAESLTIGSGLSQSPGDWKTTIDAQFCNGMNQTMMHLWSLQYDVTARPGLVTYDLLNANMTWWSQSDGFLDYLARCQHLLRQGLFVADACCFYGEGSAKFVPGKEFVRPSLPDGHDFDGMNAEVLLTRVSVRNGSLALPDGTRYRYLILPERAGWEVSPQVLAKIRQLAEAGATIVGPRPLRAPGLTDSAARDKEVKRLTASLWGTLHTARGQRTVGKGRVVWGMRLSELFASDHLPADCETVMPAGRMGDLGKIGYIHRRIGENTDLYFVANLRNRATEVVQRFRVTGREPELWHPLTGEIHPLNQFQKETGSTAIRLKFEPAESYFIVFRAGTRKKAAKAPNFPELKPLMEVGGPWEVAFDPAWGGPEHTVFNGLQDWSRQPEEGVRHYSGVGVYRKRFELPQGARRTGQRLFLDLGTVKNTARVRLNGRDLGVVWTAPWRVEITGAVGTGENMLEVEVANLWMNRLIGDAALPPSQRRTHTNAAVSASQPLLPSGLLGPVQILKTPW